MENAHRPVVDSEGSLEVECFSSAHTIERGILQKCAMSIMPY